ncbi:MAG: hypothetical protein HN337_02405 [Deltaproteobacteria bacterium]|jgi:hypothetical protein|nr:hypothetical protein [Deltaproteobacteria bacterium]
MSKVGSKKFGEGWQNRSKSTSKKLADTRRSSASKEARQANKMIEKAHVKVSNKPNLTKGSDQIKREALIKPGKQAPQSFEKNRPETQDRASRQSKMASQEFIKNRHDAQNLRKLQTKTVATTRTSEQPVTKQAVVTKGVSVRADLGKDEVQQNAPKVAKQAGEVAQKQIAKEKAASHLPSAKGYKKPEKGRKAAKPLVQEPPVETAKKPPAEQKVVIPQMTKKPDASQRTEKKSDKKKSEKKDRATKSSARVAYTGESNATNDLNAMLGGHGGGANSDNNESEAGTTAITKADGKDGDNRLPEEDPNFHVYSEFDTDNPGIEIVKSKAQLFNRHIAKSSRLEEIAKLNNDLDTQIEDLFENKGFKDRIVGDLKNEIKLADMLGSPYGTGFRG